MWSVSPPLPSVEKLNIYPFIHDSQLSILTCLRPLTNQFSVCQDANLVFFCFFVSDLTRFVRISPTFVCPRLRDSVCQLAVPGGSPRPSTQPGCPVCGLRGLAVGHGRGAGGKPLPHVTGQEKICHR